jgi:hypothetical protein
METLDFMSCQLQLQHQTKTIMRLKQLLYRIGTLSCAAEPATTDSATPRECNRHREYNRVNVISVRSLSAESK